MFTPQLNLVRNVPRQFWRLNDLVERHELLCMEEDGIRFYAVPDYENHEVNLYRSVTTIIGEHADKSWYPQWVARVGQEEADRITAIAARRGKAIHEMTEGYLKGKDYWYGQQTINIVDFNRLVPLLNRNVGKIYGLELPLFSHRLKTAGRTDVACEWDGTTTIVDFKTSRREKLKEQITDYFIQSAVYSQMFTELYDLTIEQIVVIILEDNEIEPKVFIEDPANWTEKINEYFLS